MKLIRITLLILLIVCAAAGVSLLYFFQFAEYGFSRTVSVEECALREEIVAAAVKWAGTAEGSDAHREILGIYNSHTPLAMDYPVTETDNWCAAFASAVAIECGLTEIIPTECGCQRQIGLWEDIARWEENDNYLPLPGDFIYYAWDDQWTMSDCTGWADHVGIVVGTAGPFIKVVEGNWSDQVSIRILCRFHPEIRGYGLPDYEAYAEKNTAD